MVMHELIQAIMRDPFRYRAEDFPHHCGLQALIRVAQEVETHRQERQPGAQRTLLVLRPVGT